MKEYEYEIGGNLYKVKIKRADDESAAVIVNGKEYQVAVKTKLAAPAPRVQETARPSAAAPAPVASKSAPAAASPGVIAAPMPGTILRLLAKPGQEVQPGDVLLVIEAMKMENEIKAHSEGTVKEIHVSEGSSVKTGDPLVSIE